MARPSGDRRLAIGPRPLAMILVALLVPAAPESRPTFELIQPDLFGVAGGQPNAWADYDNDGDLDLFIAFRDKPNRLFRNDGGSFTDVTEAAGIGDPRKTVGAVWFDIDGDGDLDLFVANQNGDTNGLFRNDGGHFVDVAREWGVEAPRASVEFGGVGLAVADYDGDGVMDLFVANYAPSALH